MILNIFKFNALTNKYILSILLLLALPVYCMAQDITKIPKSKPVTVHGGIMGTGSIYNVEGDESMRDPYFWQFVANLNFKILGIIDMPFSAQFSKKNARYKQPSFKQFGMSPRYKSITLNLGYRSIAFSNYSLTGLTFLGASIEYQPEKSWLTSSAMYGRFFKANPYSDSTNQNFLDPSFERWGGGARVTVMKEHQEVTFIVFKAADRPNSIPTPPADSNFAPAENLVTGFTTKNKLGNNFTLKTEYSISAYTTDIRDPGKKLDNYSYLNNLSPLFKSKYSSTVAKAYEIQADYQADFIAMGISYKRIDPNYKSMGSTFIENDVEDILFNLSKSLFKKRLNFSGSFGRQHNNLDNSKQTEDVRLIGSATGSIVASKVLNINVNYSNFSTASQPALINFTDSVRYFQINKNTSFTLNYNKGNEQVRHGITCMLALQEGSALNRSATLMLETKNKMMNGNVYYNISWPGIGMSMAAALQGSQFKAALIATKSYGPSLSVIRKLFKSKMNLALNYSYQLINVSANGNSTSNIIRINSDFKFNKYQSINLYSSYLSRKQAAGSENKPDFRELQAGLTYQFTF